MWPCRIDGSRVSTGSRGFAYRDCQVPPLLHRGDRPVWRHGRDVAGRSRRCLFGYPNAHEQDAENTLRAALALIEAVRQLDISIVPPLHVRIGIASGLVVA